MVDQGPATGFSRGYFGCFGVLAAIGTVGLAILVWLAVASRTGPSPFVADQPQPIHYSDADVVKLCAASLAPAAAGYRVKGPLKTRGQPVQGFGNAGGTADCPASDRRGALDVGIRMNCADASNLGCFTVLAVYRNGDEVPARK